MEAKSVIKINLLGTASLSKFFDFNFFQPLMFRDKLGINAIEFLIFYLLLQVNAE